MTARRIHVEHPLPGLTLAVPGCPDDGREYVEIEADTPVKGARVVWYSFATHGHRWGYIVSEWPRAGEHIDRSWPIEKRALYWVAIVPDEDMPDYLRAATPQEKAAATLYVSTNRAWLAPVPIPPQRVGEDA